MSRVTAEYRKRDDGGLDVINRGYLADSKTWKQARGKAYFVDSRRTSATSRCRSSAPSTAATWSSNSMPRTTATHWSAGPDRSYLWLLARSPTLDAATRDRLVARAAAVGFDTSKLIFVDHCHERDGRSRALPERALAHEHRLRKAAVRRMALRQGLRGRTGLRLHGRGPGQRRPCHRRHQGAARDAARLQRRRSRRADARRAAHRHRRAGGLRARGHHRAAGQQAGRLADGAAPASARAAAFCRRRRRAGLAAQGTRASSGCASWRRGCGCSGAHPLSWGGRGGPARS